MAGEVLEVGEGEASSSSRGFVLFTIWNAFLMDSETLPWPLADFKTLVKTFNSHTYGFLSVDQRAYQKSVELQSESDFFFLQHR